MSDSGFDLRAIRSAASSGDSWLYRCLPELQLLQYSSSSSSDTFVLASRCVCARRLLAFLDLEARQALCCASSPLGVIVCCILVGPPPVRRFVGSVPWPLFRWRRRRRRCRLDRACCGFVWPVCGCRVGPGLAAWWRTSWSRQRCRVFFISCLLGRLLLRWLSRRWALRILGVGVSNGCARCHSLTLVTNSLPVVRLGRVPRLAACVVLSFPFTLSSSSSVRTSAVVTVHDPESAAPAMLLILLLKLWYSGAVIKRSFLLRLMEWGSGSPL